MCVRVSVYVRVSSTLCETYDLYIGIFIESIDNDCKCKHIPPLSYAFQGADDQFHQIDSVQGWFRDGQRFRPI